MEELEQVVAFINDNIYHSDVFDRADEGKRVKAINNAKRILKRLIPNAYLESIPIEDLAEQTVWLMRIDDAMLRADMGATSVSVDGIAIAIADKNRSLSPVVLEINHLSEGFLNRRKVCGYDRTRNNWGCGYVSHLHR